VVYVGDFIFPVKRDDRKSSNINNSHQKNAIEKFAEMSNSPDKAS